MAENKRTGNIFWIYFTFLSIIALFYLAFWSLINESIFGFVIFAIFIIMIAFSIIISRAEVFRLEGSFRNNAFWFTLGFWLWGGVIILSKTRQFSVLSVVTLPTDSIVAEISATLPAFWNFMINNITNPFNEELFWLIAIPYAVIYLFEAIGESSSLSFMKSNVAKFIGLFLVSGITFPLFHVGLSGLLIFAIAAFMFRGVMIVLYWPDELLDIFPDIKVAASMMVGMHMANNWFTYGFFKGIEVLTTNWFGWIIILSIAALFIAAIDWVIEKPFKWFAPE